MIIFWVPVFKNPKACYSHIYFISWTQIIKILQLRALVGLSKDPKTVSITYLEAHIITPVPRNIMLLIKPMMKQSCIWCTYIHAYIQQTFICVKLKKFGKRISTVDSNEAEKSRGHGKVSQFKQDKFSGSHCVWNGRNWTWVILLLNWHMQTLGIWSKNFILSPEKIQLYQFYGHSIYDNGWIKTAWVLNYRTYIKKYLV